MEYKSIPKLLNRMLAFYKYLIWYFCFVSYEFFNFFWNMLSSKAAKIGCIVRCNFIITIYKANQWSSIDLNSSRFITYVPSSFLGKWFHHSKSTIKLSFILVILLYFKISYEAKLKILICSNVSFTCPSAINRFPNKLAPNEHNDIPRNLTFSFFCFAHTFYQ